MFVNEVGGDYLWDESPGTSVGSAPATATRLEALADKRTNVRVELPSGKVTAKRHATMPTVPLRLLDTAADCREFPVLDDFGTDAPTAYTLPSRTVSCALVRAITSAWSAGEALRPGASGPPSKQLIAGWRCVGTNLQRPPDWGIYMHVTCTEDRNAFELRALLPRTSSQLGATAQ